MKQWKLHLLVYTVFSSCLEFSLTSSPFAFSMLQTLQQQKIAFLFFLNGTISNFCVLPVSPSTFCVRKTAHEEITVHSGTDSGNSGWWQDVYTLHVGVVMKHDEGLCLSGRGGDSRTLPVMLWWPHDGDHLLCCCGDSWWGRFRFMFWQRLIRKITFHDGEATWWRLPYILGWWFMMREIRSCSDGDLWGRTPFVSKATHEGDDGDHPSCCTSSNDMMEIPFMLYLY